MTVRFLISSTSRRGAEVAAFQLAPELATLGVETAIAALEPGTGSNQLDVRVLGAGRRDLSMWRAARAWVKRGDTIVACGGSTLVVGAVIARLTGASLVYRNIGDPSVWANVRAAKQRIGWPLRQADLVIALYQGAAEFMARSYGVDSDRFVVVSNAGDASSLEVPDADQIAAARARFELDPGTSWLGYVGALSSEKDPLAAIDLAKRVGCGLLIAGDGPLRDEVEAAARASAQPVAVLGQVRDVAEVFAAVDAVVIPSHTEGIPGVAIEALLSGRPVVSYDVGGVSEVLADNPGGFLVPPADPDLLAESVTNVLSMRFDNASIRNHAMAFDVSAIARQWSDALAALDRSPS